MSGGVEGMVRRMEEMAESRTIVSGPETWLESERNAYARAVLAWKAVVLRRYETARLGAVSFLALARPHSDA